MRQRHRRSNVPGAAMPRARQHFGLDNVGVRQRLGPDNAPDSLRSGRAAWALFGTWQRPRSSLETGGFPKAPDWPSPGTRPHRRQCLERLLPNAIGGLPGASTDDSEEHGVVAQRSSPAVCPASRCALLVVCCLTLDAWCPPFVVWSLLPSAGLFALSFVARRPSAAVRCSMPGACHSVWPLPSACRRLRPLGSVARRLRPRPLRRSSRSAWRSLLCACETPPPFLCGRLLFLLPPHAESPLRLLRR